MEEILLEMQNLTSSLKQELEKRQLAKTNDEIREIESNEKRIRKHLRGLVKEIMRHPGLGISKQDIMTFMKENSEQIGNSWIFRVEPISYTGKEEKEISYSALIIKGTGAKDKDSNIEVKDSAVELTLARAGKEWQNNVKTVLNKFSL